ncbi:MAG: pseudouridine synthase [Eubacteriales bacterium]|nr:pseudouridine synthase [Eubacteriales bacterium]MDD3881632.1 pseudouridine synthase [Eubacteriales bacterium]MDD4512309.1 pseudouridine synthase [Eubacteriales bacterium]
MVRLDKLLSALSVGSRSDVTRIIRQGRVTVNGRAALDAGEKLDESAEIALDGAILDSRFTRHVMLNKPSGVLTAARDKNQPTVMDLLPNVYSSLSCMPVGRLDKDTTGLLLFTTDGELSHRLLSPKRHVWKTYEARCAGRLTQESERAIAEGLVIDDMKCLPARLEILSATDSESLCRLSLREGKFHQVKRMLEVCGCPVTELKRLTFGSLALDESLSEGEWRELTTGEIDAIYADSEGANG